MPHVHHRVLSLLLGLLCLVGLNLGAVQLVAAHAYLERAEPPVDAVLPASPPTLHLWFTEEIEPAFSEVVVIDAARQPVHTSQAAPSADHLSLVLDLPALPDGSYTVTWRVLSAVDGHTTRGFHSLTVGAATPAPVAPLTDPPPPAGPPLILQAIVRWLTFLGQAVLTGGLLFGPLVLASTLAAAGDSETGSIRQGIRRRRLMLHAGAVALLGLAALAGLLVQTAIASDLPLSQTLGAPILQVLATRYGLIWCARIVLLALLAGFVIWRWRRADAPGWTDGIGIALGLSLLLTTSLTSHGAAVRDRPLLAILADWLHLIATSAWLGGLAQLIVIIPLVITTLAEKERVRLLAPLVARFSTLSLASVGILIATGVYAAFLHLSSVEALLTTDYGRALLGKLVLLLPMLGLGAINMLHVSPTLARPLKEAGKRAVAAFTAAARVIRVLGRTVRGEFALGLLILAATGMLTSIAPARQPSTATAGAVMTETAGDLRLSLRITPAQLGDNTVELTVRNQQGQPVDDVTRALLRLSFLDQDLGENEIVLAPAGAGRYGARTRQLSVAGQWQAEIIVRRTGQDDVRTAMRFAMPYATAAPAARAGGPSVPALTTSGWVALILLFLAAILIIMSRRLRAASILSGGLLGSGVGALALRLYLLATTGPIVAPGPVASQRNPYPPTAQSLATGLSLYTAHCQSCHGIAGQGDGPVAASLLTPPLDLTQHVAFHSDAELYRMISQGVRGTAMPAFAGILSEEERWHVLTYIRTFEATGESARVDARSRP